jgi:hypothetical protein
VRKLFFVTLALLAFGERGLCDFGFHNPSQRTSASAVSRRSAPREPRRRNPGAGEGQLWPEVAVEPLLAPIQFNATDCPHHWLDRYTSPIVVANTVFAAVRPPVGRAGRRQDDPRDTRQFVGERDRDDRERLLHQQLLIQLAMGLGLSFVWRMTVAPTTSSRRRYRSPLLGDRRDEP